MFNRARLLAETTLHVGKIGLSYHDGGDDDDDDDNDINNDDKDDG